MTTPHHLLLIGCGRMGSALLAGWKANPNLTLEVSIVEPDHSQHAALAKDGAAHTYSSVDDIPKDITPDSIMLAVKPQILDIALPAISERFGAAPLYLSIAAGKTLNYYKQQLGEHAHVIRIMPNTPAMIGQGISGLCASEFSTAHEHAHTEQLMKSVGDAVWLEDESEMDALTALSGSGPAYVFYFIESLIAAGVRAGLNEKTAEALAKKTVEGSAMLASQSDLPLSTLRKNVTSPGGTTAAALDVWMADDGLGKLAQNAIDAAAQRSKELSD